MNATRAEVEQLLRDRYDVLERRHRAMEAHLRNEDGRLDVDDVERASWTEGDEVLERLDEAALAELDQLRGALARVADGTFGVCTSCGADIAPGRLAAVPGTPWCAACAP